MEAKVNVEGLLNKGHNCCLCDNMAATSVCINCGDMFCVSCGKLHTKQTMAKSHRVVPLSSLASYQPDVGLSISADVSSEIPKTLCPAHGMSVCYLCYLTLPSMCSEAKDGSKSEVMELPAELQELADSVTREQRTLNQVTTLLPAMSDVDRKKPAEFRFHDNHGINIILSDSQQKAERTRGCDGIVVSRDPMVINMMYEIEINNTKTSAAIHLGVLTRSPNEVSLPVVAPCLTSAVVVSPYMLFVNGWEEYEVEESLQTALGNVEEGSLIGVGVDADRCLHVVVNGQDWKLSPSVSLPCFALFDLSHRLTKVTALPVREMSW